MRALTTETHLTGRHILLMLLGFFGIVFAVNGVFVYVALSTRPGEESGAGYDAGLHYNATLAAERAQRLLEWTHKALVLPGRLRVTIVDAHGDPVAGLAITGRLDRPASSSSERPLSFTETGAGNYEAALDSLEPGNWVLAFAAKKAIPSSDVATYHAKVRLWLSPPL